METNWISAKRGTDQWRDLMRAYSQERIFDHDGQPFNVVSFDQVDVFQLEEDETTGPPPPPPPPPGDELEIKIAGVFHMPFAGGTGEAVHWERFKTVEGSWSYFSVSFYVTIHQWNGDRKLHNLFWMVRNSRNKDMIGYMNIFAPPRPAAHMRHGMGQANPDKAKVGARLVPEVNTGDRIRIDYRYDITKRKVSGVISRLGETLAQLVSKPNIIDRIVFRKKDELTMTFGFQPEDNPNEAASWGWTYEDLRLTLKP